MYNGHMKQERTNVRLDEQARNDARMIAYHYNLGSTSAAIRFALREIARRIDPASVATNVAGDIEKDPNTAS